MRTPTIDYTEEKVALANELGLEKCAYALLAEKEAKKEVEELTKLRFKPIDRKKIEHMLKKRIFKFFHHTNFYGEFIGVTIVSGIFFGIDLLFRVVDPHAPHNIAFLILGSLLGTMSFFLFARSSFPKCEAHGKLLSEWDETLPRGALLAVKEAKEAGLADFRIFYPVLESKRVRTDPIITGKKPGSKIALLVHAWDDGKVHE
ncbi:MAG TPA: hypothetical protein VIJ14_02205 [Rhabdochlamydiaceae bacterium]